MCVCVEERGWVANLKFKFIRYLPTYPEIRIQLHNYKTFFSHNKISILIHTFFSLFIFDLRLHGTRYSDWTQRFNVNRSTVRPYTYMRVSVESYAFILKYWVKNDCILKPITLNPDSWVSIIRKVGLQYKNSIKY